MRTATKVMLATAATALVLGVTACSDDDDSKSGPSNAEYAEFCEAKLAADSVPQMSPTYMEDVLPLVADANEAAPDDIADAMEIVHTSYEKMAEGDESVFEDPEFAAAQGDVAVWVDEECGFTSVSVKSVDYSFEGLPSSISAGPVSFLNENTGEEPHVAVVMKVPENLDLSDPMEILMAEEPPKGVEMVGAAFVAPGDTAGFSADLEPGKYFVFCDIPVGGEETGDPHFLHGMQGTFIVT